MKTERQNSKMSPFTHVLAVAVSLSLACAVGAFMYHIKQMERDREILASTAARATTDVLRFPRGGAGLVWWLHDNPEVSVVAEWYEEDTCVVLVSRERL